MDYILLIMQMLTIVGILAGSYWFRNYLPSYFGKKGENLATKEDIEDITHKIESTRSLYLSDIEKLKSELQMSSQQHSKFIEQQREALLNFFEDCVVLIGEKMQTHLGGLPSDKGKSLFEYQESVKHLFFKIYIDYHKLILYFSDDLSLPKAAEEIVKHSIESKRAFEKHFGKLKISLIEEQTASASGDKSTYRSYVGATNEAGKEYEDAIHPSLNAMSAAFQQYMVALNKYLRTQGSVTIPESLLSNRSNTT